MKEKSLISRDNLTLDSPDIFLSVTHLYNLWKNDSQNLRICRVEDILHGNSFCNITSYFCLSACNS